MEIVIVDLAAPDAPPLKVAPAASLVYISRPGTKHWGQARAEALRSARGPIVAFIEDHCFPHKTWAEKLIEAHQGPWGAVGYAFTNANARSYVSRAALLARYGSFTHPA